MATTNLKEFLDKTGTLFIITKLKEWVNGIIPTKNSQLENDSNFITSADVPEGAAASTTLPKMAGTAAIGVETAFARGDHVHPSDTTKVDKVSGKGLSTNDYTTAEKTKLAGIAAGANNYVLPTASSTKLGGVTVGDNIVNSSGKISVPSATESVRGVVALANTISATDSGAAEKAATPQSIISYVSTVVGSPFKFGGSVNLSDLPNMPTDDNVNVMYNMKSQFTTTSAFIEGAGNTYPAGTNIMGVNLDGAVKYDVVAGFVDLSPYALTSDFAAVPTSELEAMF